jgi:uncharacterized membrane protein
MNKLLIILLLGFIIVIIDYIYLSIIKNYFNNQISLIQGSKMNVKLLPAILCYLFIVFVLYYFIINKNASILESMCLGWSIYFIYELTNKAIINKWKWKTVLLDGIWGGILFGISTVIINYLLDKKIKLY